MDRWQGKTAVVTGAGSGIGAAIAEALARRGVRVVALERSPELINEMKFKSCQDCCIIPRQCNISKPEEIAAAFSWVEENHDGVQILVNNAGVLKTGQITAVGTDPLTEEQILTSIDTNLKGTIICARHAVASMKINKFDGHIINISSIAGHYIPFCATMNVYASTKHAVTAFTRSLANEFAHFNSKIRTTSISPGYTNTGMALDNVEFPVLQPSDIADAVLYALSTPPHVNITELTVQPIMEKRLYVGNHPLSEAEIEATIGTNVKGLILSTRHAVASMKRRGFNGHIINISSVVGHYVSVTPTFDVFVPCSKHAVRALGAQLNNELAHFHSNIKVTSINPGLVQTQLAAGLVSALQPPTSPRGSSTPSPRPPRQYYGADNHSSSSAVFVMDDVHSLSNKTRRLKLCR